MESRTEKRAYLQKRFLTRVTTDLNQTYPKHRNIPPSPQRRLLVLRIVRHQREHLLRLGGVLSTTLRRRATRGIVSRRSRHTAEVRQSQEIFLDLDPRPGGGMAFDHSLRSKILLDLVSNGSDDFVILSSVNKEVRMQSK
jgi:hypothetical protein